MADSADSEETLGDLDLAREMFARFEAGESKSALEIEFWNDGTSHGKRFTSFIRNQLGIETEAKSRQTQELDRLQNLLKRRGISPTPAGDLSSEDRLVAKAREAALAAVRLYNDPLAGFRTDGFIVLMVIAWNSILQAMLERKGIDYYEKDDGGKSVVIDGRAKVKATWELVQIALPGDAAIRSNLDFFLKLRHRIEHRYIPALDMLVTSEAQAMLLNFETILVGWFGEEAALGDQLIVPLQLSALRSEAQLKSLKQLEKQVPVDVMNFLARHREEVPAEVLRSHQYAMPLFFVPVTANRQGDAVVRFLSPGSVPPDVERALQEIYVVSKPKPVPVVSADLLRPTEVVNLVAARLPYRFTTASHTRCWRYYKVRPPTSAAEPAATDTEFCIYDKLLRGYGYTQAWVDRLVGDLSDKNRYEDALGVAPRPV